MPRKIAVVEWVDASWDSASVRPNEIEPLARMVECGWLVHQDREAITLALEVCTDDERVRHTVSIPRSGIVRMQVVAVWDGAKKRKKK